MQYHLHKHFIEIDPAERGKLFDSLSLWLFNYYTIPMENQLNTSSPSVDNKQEKAIQLTSLIGDFLIDPLHADIYTKLKAKWSKEDVQFLKQLRKWKEGINSRTSQKLWETLSNPSPIITPDSLELLISQDISDTEIDAIRKLYADPEVREIYFDEYESRKDDLDLLRRWYKQLGKVQKIDDIISKAKDKILGIRIAAFAANRQLSPNEIIHITKLHEAISQQESEKKNMLKIREIATAYRHQQLKTYKHQMDTEWFVITPSRVKIIDEIIEKILLGQNVLLTGPTGTGKTVLAIQAVKTIAARLHIWLEAVQGKALAHELQNNPDAEKLLDEFVVVLSGHAGITPSEFIAKMWLKWDDKWGTQTYTQLGKVLKAFVDGNIPIIDEIDLIPNDVLMRIKHLFTLKSGKTYSPQEDGNQKHKLLTTTVIATANIKSAKHPDRQEIDPAIVRLLPGVEVKYLPSEETYDLGLINIMEPKWFVYWVGVESLSHTDGILYHLIEALKQIEDNYLGKWTWLTISNKSNMFLQKAVLELWSFVALFKWFKESGQDFAEFIKAKIIKFVSNGAYPKNDRMLLINIFSGKGLVTQNDVDSLLERMSDISKEELEQNILWGTSFTFPQDTIRFVDPYQLANFDPYKKRNLETLELEDKNMKIKSTLKQISAHLLTLPNEDTEDLQENLDNILDEYVKNPDYEINHETIDQIFGWLYELWLVTQLLECSRLGDYWSSRIEMIKLFDSKDKNGKGLFENTEIPSKESISLAKEVKENISSSLPSMVAKQEKDATKYFTDNSETNHLEIITGIQKLRDKKMITYKDTGNGTYEVHFNLPWSKLKRYMPSDTSIADSSSKYTLWDDTELKPQETTRNKLRSDEWKKYLKDKEQKENKNLLNKSDFLKLWKALYPNGTEEEQILAIMIATGFYGWMWLSDKDSDYQLAVFCSRDSDHRLFDKLNSGSSRCSIIYTSTL